VVAVLALWAVPAVAAAHEFVVNTTVDTDSPPEAHCLGGPTSTCSLREAIEEAEANGNGERDTITFAEIPAGSVLRIEEAPLPELSADLTIDGFTAEGSTGNEPSVELEPVDQEPPPGLEIRGAHGVRIEGLAIGGFGTGIVVGAEDGATAAGTEICGNYLGVELGGFGIRPNGVGVEVRGEPGELQEETTIGDPGESCPGNVISGNEFDGIEDSGLETTIAGNRIGLGPFGSWMPNGTGGGSTAGVYESATASGAMIGGVGGSGEETNLISRNEGAGVQVENTTSEVSIRHNAISDNKGPGIEILSGTQPVPSLTTVEQRASRELVVKGTVEVTEAETVELEFFGNEACEAGGTGQGATILGSGVLPVSPGVNDYEFILPVNAPVDDTGFTATATREAGATSEFSECITYEPERTFTVNTTDDGLHPGECTDVCSLREAVFLADETAAKDTIDFAAGAEGVIKIEGQPLEEIRAPLIIDGTSAPGYLGSPVVMINGTESENEGPTTGFWVGSGDGSVIKGLAIGGFDEGVVLGGEGAQVCSDWIGVELDGTTALADNVGVEVNGDTSGNEIGDECGPSAAPNVISGNSEAGVYDGGIHTLIEGNLIGVGPDGTTALPNGAGDGVGAGVIVGGGSRQSRVGLNLSEEPAGEGNTIAHNDGPGVLVEGDALSPSIRRSEIYANGGGSIVFETPNAVPSPALEGFAAGPTGTAFFVQLEGALPNETYEFDIFASAQCEQPDEAGPAEVLLASGEAETDVSGEVRARIDGRALTGIDAESFTVTTTEASTGTTSQISHCTFAPSPETTVESAPPPVTSSTSATLTFSGFTYGRIAKFECSLDEGSFEECSSPQLYTGLAPGSHTFEAVAVSGEGVQGPVTSVTSWTVDTEPPEVSITSGPSGITNAASATFEFEATDSGSDVTSVECSLDGAPFSSCDTPQEYSGLADGPHTFEVKATDAAGNTSVPVVRSWKVVTEAPSPAITMAPPATTEATGATFEFSSSPDAEVSSFECSIDGGTFGPCTSPQSFSGLAPGGHTFAVRALDAAGNTSQATTYKWTVATKEAPKAEGSKATPPPPGPTPTNGETIVVKPEKGKVLIKLPGTKKFVPLEELKEIPVGAVIDATKGRVKLTSRNPDGTEQTAEFFEGVFRVKQKEGSGLVVLELLDTRACPAPRVKQGKKGKTPRVAGASSIAARPGSGTAGKLWGSGHGNFRTEGNDGSATVRGTIWLVEDRCNGTTFFKTRRDVVTVKDFITHKSFPLREGHSYLAGE
jgi:CSLREA domain-containing protein